MTERDTGWTGGIDPGHLPGIDSATDGDVVIDASQADEHTEITDTEVYQGELEARGALDGPLRGTGARVEGLTDLELRSGETADPNVAAEEGLAYVAPTDPPVVPTEHGLVIAAGISASAMDEPYDADHHTSALPDEDEMAARVREALRADAMTSGYADRVAIGTRGGTIVLRGMVDDLDDTDELVAVAQRVTGVEEVVDELAVEGMDQPPAGA